MIVTSPDPGYNPSERSGFAIVILILLVILAFGWSK